LLAAHLLLPPRSERLISGRSRSRPGSPRKCRHRREDCRALIDAPRRHVIIGNGIAGTTAAETLRRGDPNCSIVLITDEPYTLYNRVALPPFLKLQIPESKVFLKNLEFHEKNRIDLHLETRVV